MTSDNSNFYSDLKVHNLPISQLVSTKSLFEVVPENWHILVSDIRDSTGAIRNGRHNEVNLVATGSVIAILNLAHKAGTRVPFFFGGDGSILLIPETLLQESLSVLDKHRKNSLANFKLDLKIGHIQVKDIYDDGMYLKIARTQITKAMNIPIVLGKGLQFAEKKIKESETNFSTETEEARLDLRGMECKWDQIEPPGTDKEVLSLIVDGCHNEDPSQVYSEILQKMDEIYGSHSERKPVTVDKLKLRAGLRQIRAELKAKFGRSQLIYLLKDWLVSSIGEIYLKNTPAGKKYMKKLVELTDNLSIDGRINTVITGTPHQREELINYLEGIEKNSKIRFGYYVSGQSVMSCYVYDIQSNDHIHFVDGANGGYTNAANHLKGKLNAS